MSPERRRRPLFTVLIAAYNHAAFVTGALDSVAAQTCDDFEIVIVDDGSTDDTAAVVRRWIAAFTRHRRNRAVLLETANRGQSAAIEHGLAWCRGSWVCLLDSDDWWMKEKLEAVRDVVETDPDLVMVGHPVLVTGASGAPTGEIRPRRARLARGDLRTQVRRTGRSVAAVTSGVCVRADVMQSLRPFPTKAFRFGADGYVTMGATLRGRIDALDAPLAFYRLHPEGQYLRRMLSADGPRVAIELHRTIARHFGLEHALGRSSYFMRHVFADAKLWRGFSAQVRAYCQLVGATVRDEAFSRGARLALVAFWTACLLAPRPVFHRLWCSFQLRHIGLASVRAHG